MKKVVALLPVEDFWRPLLATLCCLTILSGLLTFRLGTLTPAFSEAEYQQRSVTNSVNAVVDNPLHSPQRLGQFGLQKLGRKGPAAMRFPGVLISFVAVIAMFIILKNWYTVRVAALGTLMFATSSWLLHVSRLATPDINFILPLLLLVGGVWLQQGKFMAAAVPLTFVTAVAMLYVPGMIWLVLPAAVWQRRLLKRTLRHLNAGQQVAVILITLLGLVPLIWSFVFHPNILASWLGFPENWPSLSRYLKNILEIPLEIFIRGSGEPAYGIGRLPLLDAFTGFMVILGVFVSFFHLRLDRTRILLGAGVVAGLLIALDGPFKLAFLLPIIYLLAAGGVALLLQQWFTIFPRNPVARALGVIIVSSAVLLACYYHISHYFIAWPNVPATKQAFNIKP